jgi:Fe-S-cluster-containing hydrogenase component 2
MYQVDKALCTGCGTCLTVCPVEAIDLQDDRAHVNGAACTGCGACADVCPQGAMLATEPIRSLALPQVVQPTGQRLPILVRSQAEIVPAPARATQSVWRRQIWPAVGAALVWTSRELLPEVLAAWCAAPPSKRNSALPADQALPQGQQSGPRTQGGVQACGRQHRRREMRRGL